MNFEEHCEVLLTSNGNDRQVDADILAKCLLKSRQKSRLAGIDAVADHSRIFYDGVNAVCG